MSLDIQIIGTTQERHMQIEGTVALVTGANRGIGKAFVQALLERGAATVYAGARDPSSVDVADPRVIPIALDVTSDADVAAAAEQAGDVRLVINNAGVAETGTPLEADLDAARRHYEVNVLGVVRTTQAFAPVLARNGDGAFVNVLSLVSWAAIPVLSTYAASKAAAWSYTNAARIQLQLQGTHVVGVHVGFVDTDLASGFDVEKTPPASVASVALDALEAGEPEAIVDEGSRQVKAGLSDDQNLIYPGIAAEFAAQVAS
jgi:NAD(P)-dependent dehydrogenase (short-subunit alcohol dehydrogenase family)